MLAHISKRVDELLQAYVKKRQIWGSALQRNREVMPLHACSVYAVTKCGVERMI